MQLIKKLQHYFKGKKLFWNLGQLITGRKSIAEKLKISESKIYRIINEYKSEHQIEQQTSNRNSLITILNWDKYQQFEQQNEQQMNNKRTTDEQQVNTNKNETMKELLEERNIYARAREEKLELFDYDWMNDDDEN